MTSHMPAGDTAVNRPYEVTVVGASLMIVIRKEFDFSNLQQDWAASIRTLHPGPFTEVRVDLSRTGLVSSTFLAGVLQLQQHYQSLGSALMILDRPDLRVVRTLGMMHLDQLFTVIPRA
mgnify:CR=1 FL=1